MLHDNKPTTLRHLTEEESKEVLKQFHEGCGAKYMIADIEEFIEESLRAHQEANATVSLELFNGIYTLRRVMNLLRYVDPYRKSI